ncbi:arylamine N-acetyltransferase [Virgisporangium aliadipatigenens]|uniref:Arylamine N-acetyltransferase n=1 Tax=Virgisporangium aliadipatigenens TaxID=741659 RepID=A0A8J3YIC5_9ACTN|nr:arylamine N-acetyltransferase [Virgisporangium aliadipatigenens]GIJ44483.1 arylamine N-acetyltransferase [Virgisporangium aliadipatigenens]
MDLDACLRRLGLSHPGPPSVAALRTVHRAMVERVAYENIDIYRGRPEPPLDVDASAARIASGRGGFCYHVNATLGGLLDALGYTVVRHIGGVYGRDEEPVGASGNHLALTVSGLPAPQCPDGVWLVDAGLGDGPHEPLPLREGVYRQGPFTYGLGPSRVIPGGWHFTHDAEYGSFRGFDFRDGPAAPEEFEETSRFLTYSAESPFRRQLTVQRRDAGGVDVLRGCVYTRIDGEGRRSHTLHGSGEWFAFLRERFGLTLSYLDIAERAELWRKVRAQHEEWAATHPS